MSSADGKTALITGGGSGIGRAAAARLRRAGCRVYEMSRRDVESGDAVHIRGDVTAPDDVGRAVKRVIEIEGRLDILVCNAGMGIAGAAEFTPPDDARAQFDVNYFGAVNAVSASLEYLRAGRGVVVFVSSVAAKLPVPFQAHYSASKAALNAFALALANEVRPFGVRVRVVMPGDTATGFTAARRRAQRDGADYGGRDIRAVAVMERDERRGMTADRVAAAVVRAATCRRAPPLRAAGCRYKLFCALAKLLPARLSNWIVGRIYA
ncbi:MAG: SDR family NAD(P)-dependent oxidoreductase [Oscillospiraceae bacterium]|nr:SDR family NAD(P)-dependent oxidoreductase [Oscillospiraceae bacterium]